MSLCLVSLTELNCIYTLCFFRENIVKGIGKEQNVP